MTLAPGTLCTNHGWSVNQIMIVIFSGQVWCDTVGCRPLGSVSIHGGFHQQSLQQYVSWQPCSA